MKRKCEKDRNLKAKFQEWHQWGFVASFLELHEYVRMATTSKRNQQALRDHLRTPMERVTLELLRFYLLFYIACFVCLFNLFVFFKDMV
jgi:hypothetical protein